MDPQCGLLPGAGDGAPPCAAPGSGYQKYIRFFTGLVLILLVLAPVLKLFQMEEELRDAYRDDSWLEQLEEIEGVEEIQIGDH